MKKVYELEATAISSGEVGVVEMSEERIAKHFPRALNLGVGESMELIEEEAGYTDYQNFIETITRVL